MMEEGPRKVRAKVYRIPRSPFGCIAKVSQERAITVAISFCFYDILNGSDAIY